MKKPQTQTSVLEAITGAEQAEALALLNTTVGTTVESIIHDEVKDELPLTDGGELPREEGTEEPKDEAPKPTAWGNFAIEVGIEPSSKSQANTKYDWASFPAPSDPKNSKTWPSVFIPKIGSKSISGSIKTYRDKLQAENKVAPEFTISVVKDKEGKEAIGVRVFRKS